MKAITVDPVWAWVIFRRIKPVENRTWRTRHRGELAIHAGQGTPERNREARALLESLGYRVPETLPTGAVVALATLGDCLSIDELRRVDPPLADNAFCSGPFCWILKNVRPIEPIPCAGKQGLWNFEYQPLIRAN